MTAYKDYTDGFKTQNKNKVHSYKSSDRREGPAYQDKYRGK